MRGLAFRDTGRMWLVEAVDLVLARPRLTRHEPVQSHVSRYDSRSGFGSFRSCSRTTRSASGGNFFFADRASL